MSISLNEILGMCDHTLLKQEARPEDIIKLCDEAIKYRTASVCIPPCYIKTAREYSRDLCICTVIGFPNGNMTTASKVFETRDALDKGADEIDMVINIGMLKAGETGYVADEIEAVRKACEGHILKVIIETCLLSEEEKITMCKIVGNSGADYIKTSTGFSTGGATFADVELFKANIPEGLKIKAAGGIQTIDDAVGFIERGANRLGTSRIVKLVMAQEHDQEVI